MKTTNTEMRLSARMTTGVDGVAISEPLRKGRYIVLRAWRDKGLRF